MRPTQNDSEDYAVFEVYGGMSERLPLSGVADHARRVEAMGYDGLLVPEAVHDGFLASMAALTATQRLTITTSVLVVFPRSPMIVAHAAWDLQALSGGRFELGLGTQVRGNIVRRFSTPWTSPVPRMREYVESLKAIFESFQNLKVFIQASDIKSQSFLGGRSFMVKGLIDGYSDEQVADLLAYIKTLK